MENAAKALTMAGSVLFAIMIISVLVFGYGKLNETSEEKEKSKIIEQIIEFNKEFESYNRKDVYGAELLSLINKIEDYNKKVTDADEGYKTITGTVRFAYTVGEAGGTIPRLYYTTNQTVDIATLITKLGGVNQALTANKMAQVLEWYNQYLGLIEKGYTAEANKCMDKIRATVSAAVIAKLPEYKKSAESVTELKRRYFKCDKVVYDDETSVGKTGRIVRMEFIEIDTR